MALTSIADTGRKSPSHWAGALAFIAALGAAPANATSAADLTELSLEELMAIEVTSAARRPERLADTAAAVFVITQEDIRRSGATSVPELLRTVPGLEVARIDAGIWAVTARGFNSRLANKLLVLVNGRSVYTPLFSGVFWEREDMLLDDIERIEVIRGPGASLWGANAVNGVINIITKPAAETQGTLVKLGAGTAERALASARYGGAIDADTHYRIFAKGLRHDEQRTESGLGGNDDWQAGRAGFRVDGAVDASESWQVHGDLYSGNYGGLFPAASLMPPYAEIRRRDAMTYGGSLFGLWERQQSDTSRVSLQAYIDHNGLDDSRLSFDETTVDLEFGQDRRFGERHHVVWGLGYRVWHGSVDGTFDLATDPETETTHLASAFVQDTINLIPETLDLTLGSKFEYHSFSGPQIQPTARLLWHVDDRNTLWAAVSRAVRTPSFGERAVRLNNRVIPPGTPENPTPLPLLVSIFGDSGIEAEELTAYEVGYRLEAGTTLSLDLTAFYNAYDNLIGARVGDPFLETAPLPPHLVQPLVATNNTEGNAYGFEAVATWQAMPNWRLQFGYGFLDLDLNTASGDGFTNLTTETEGKSPRHQASLRSLANLSENVNFDVTLRYVSDLPAIDVSDYLTLDLRLAWRPAERLELALTGRNLLGRQLEFGSETVLLMTPTEVEPSLLATVRWAF